MLSIEEQGNNISINREKKKRWKQAKRVLIQGLFKPVFLMIIVHRIIFNQITELITDEIIRLPNIFNF